MLVIVAASSWQVRISGGGDDTGDKGTRDFVFHHWQYPLNSYQCQSWSCVGIGQPNNSLDSMETTVYMGLLQLNHASNNVTPRDMEWSCSHSKRRTNPNIKSNWQRVKWNIRKLDSRES